MFHRDARDARRRASERTARRKDASESHIAPASGAFIARRAHRAHRAPPLDSAARPFPPLARALATRDDERDDATRRDATRIDSIRTALERRSSRERERERGRKRRARACGDDVDRPSRTSSVSRGGYTTSHEPSNTRMTSNASPPPRALHRPHSRARRFPALGARPSDRASSPVVRSFVFPRASRRRDDARARARRAIHLSSAATRPSARDASLDGVARARSTAVTTTDDDTRDVCSTRSGDQ